MRLLELGRLGKTLRKWRLNCGGEASNKNIGEEKKNHGISCKFSVYLEDKRLRVKMEERRICT